MKDGIILDVDGTLWNAVSVIRDSWNLYREEQIPEMPGSYTDADIEGVLGLTMTQIGDRLLAPLPEKRRHQALEGMMDAEVTRRQGISLCWADVDVFKESRVSPVHC